MTEAELHKSCQQILSDGFCVIRDLLPTDVIDACARAFEPILEAHMDEIREQPNRGPLRHYIPLPFEPPFANPVLYENETILAIVGRLIGDDAVVGSYATDTPLQGSIHQDLHGDVAALFPDNDLVTPPYVLTLNFPFVDVTADNGPFEVSRGTHRFTPAEGIRQVESGDVPLEPLLLARGDALIRDPRHIHRGSPNRTPTPRPVAVVSYIRRWYRFGGMSPIAETEWDKLSERGQEMLQFAPRN